MPRSFRILKTLGRGAFGEVHLTEIVSEDDFVQTLAVKWLHAEHSNNPELAGRLRDEARMLGLLAHPHIVRVQGLTRLDGRLAILMEPIEGSDLSGHHLPPRAAGQVIEAAADALDAAWSRVPAGGTEPLRVVHRDIKPSNLMVTTRGVVKVMDFGVARATFAAREAQTRSQQYGTARYMAPERWLEGIAESPSDIYSLGVSLVEIATGQAVSRARLAPRAFEEDQLAWLEQVAITGAAPLVPLAGRMLAFDPADRPSAAEIIDELRAIDLPGEDLATWARQNLEVPALEATAVTGTIVMEEIGSATVDFGVLPGSTSLTAATEMAPVEPPSLPTTESPTRRVAAVAMLGLLGLFCAGAGWTLLPPTSQSGLEPSPTASPSVTVPIEPRPEPVAPSPTVVPEPEPEPEPEPSPPQAEPEPTPAAVPVRPDPRPRPDQPAPTPVPSEPEEPEPRSIAVTFIVADGVTLTTSAGSLKPGRRALTFPAGSSQRVTSTTAGGNTSCRIPIGQAPTTWAIRADGSCKQR